MDGMVREDHFVITVASEIMAILCLADDLTDLKKRLGKIIAAYNFDGKPVTADDLKATGAMAALLKDAVKPNHHPDTGAYAGARPRRSVCQHRSRMQQCESNQDGSQAQRY